jgi:hypothetical protein
VEETPPSSRKPSREWTLPSLGEINEFVLNVKQLEQSFKSLKPENEHLRADSARLQRQVDEQSGQLKVLLGFVHTSLRDQVEITAEKAAVRLFQQVMDRRSGPPVERR